MFRISGVLGGGEGPKFWSSECSEFLEFLGGGS